jgi:hypothetical protein
MRYDYTSLGCYLTGEEMRTVAYIREVSVIDLESFVLIKNTVFWDVVSSDASVFRAEKSKRRKALAVR